MTYILKDNSRYRKPAALKVNPVKTAPGLGAGYAAQGFRQAMPFYHAAPGCNFLSKVLLTQHFMEPIAAAGSDIKETALVFGGTYELQNTVQKFCEKSNPEIVFILSSSIPEIRGEDFNPCLTYLEKKFIHTKFILVPTPDFQGGFSEGYAKLVYETIAHLAEGGEPIKNQVNFLPAPYMTAGDIDYFREVAQSFGLNPIVIPDLSSGPDGSKEKFSSMSVQGTSPEDVRLSGRSAATISVGESLKGAGDFLETRHKVKHVHFNSITGLSGSDDLIKLFMKLGNITQVPAKTGKDRSRLKDIMIDTHIHLNKRKVAMALEADHIMAYKTLFEEIGITPEITTDSFFDIEALIASGETVDMIIAGTHGAELAARYNVPLLRAGFPVTDRYGYNYKISVGYKGSIEIISELANALLENRDKSAHFLGQA